MDWETDFLTRYNKLIDREKKAEAFLSNPSTTEKQIEKWLPEFHKVVRELSVMMQEYKTHTGYEMQENEILNGFSLK